MSYAGGQPVLILKEGTERNYGRDAQKNNIMAAKIIAEIVRTSLGPRGMDKMLVDSFGDIVITNDGATILKEMDVAHPAAKFVIELAKTQEQEVGDGTTSVVVLAGELLKKAEEFLDMDMHPSIIIDGYSKAAEHAINNLLDKIAINVDIEDENTLLKVAKTSMESKVVAANKDKLAKIIVKAVKSVAQEVDGTYKVDLDDIKVEKKVGKEIGETELINGIVLDKEVVHAGMPKRVKNAKIALISDALEITKTEFDAKINITSPEDVQRFLEQEQQMLKDMAQKIIDAGANVVICQKGIDEVVQHYLAKAGILAVRRVKKSDMVKLAKATGGKIINTLKELTSESLGEAGLVEEVTVGEDEMIYVTKCKNPKALTILIRGGTEMMVDETERSIEDALHVVKNVIEDGKVVVGGGAPEVFLANGLREFAKTLPSRQQMAVEAFADALESIPKALAENAGMDPIDVIGELRMHHAKGEHTYGVDPLAGKVVDLNGKGILEPIRVKKQAIKSATEAAQMILRIDDVIASKGSDSGSKGGSEDFAMDES